MNPTRKAWLRKKDQKCQKNDVQPQFSSINDSTETNEDLIEKVKKLLE